MPSVTVHLLFAERVLERWVDAPAHAPFSPEDPSTVNAFRQGALGPDLGYFPGGSRPLSDLAHCFRSGDLSRELVQSARTSLERAFAWGWVTHVLADQWVHPIIGCAVGEFLYGSPSIFVSGDENNAAHVQVEAGLDAVYALRNPELKSADFQPVFDDVSINFLVNAFRNTYGVDFDRNEFISSHRSTASRLGQGLALARFVGMTLPGAGYGPLRAGELSGALQRVRELVGSRSPALAFLLPLYPPLWLLNAVGDVEGSFAELFLEEFASGLMTLGNYNLDTGRPDEFERGHGGHQRSLAFLEAATRIPAHT